MLALRQGGVGSERGENRLSAESKLEVGGPKHQLLSCFLKNSRGSSRRRLWIWESVRVQSIYHEAFWHQFHKKKGTVRVVMVSVANYSSRALSHRQEERDFLPMMGEENPAESANERAK